MNSLKKRNKESEIYGTRDTREQKSGCECGGKGRGGAVMTLAAVGTVVAVLVGYAVLSLCAAMLSGTGQSGKGLLAPVGAGSGGLLPDSCGDGYVAAMASLTIPAASGIGEAVFASGEPGEGAQSAVPGDAVSAQGCFPSVSVSAECAALMCVNTHELLWSKNADTRHAMASTTKIMTALVALENSSPSDTVRVSSEAVGIIGSSVYLYAGEEMTMESLLYALMLESANDAAAAIAISVAGDVGSFAGLMNDRAASLGLENTHFENPHGLDSEGHFTTARELAAITSEALENDAFRSIVSTYKRSIEMHDGQGSRLLINHNKLLKSYDGAIGVKTGYTSASGRCLVTAAERGGLTLIAVTLNAPDDWNDHRKMLDAGFESYRCVTLPEDGRLSFTVPVTGGKDESVLVVGEPLEVVMRTDAQELRCEVFLPHFLYAPVGDGEEAGKLVYRSGDTVVGEIKLHTGHPVQAVIKKSFFAWLAGFFTRE